MKRTPTPKQRVLRKWPNACVNRCCDYANTPDDEGFDISTWHGKGEIVGHGSTARQAWADAARRLGKGRK